MSKGINISTRPICTANDPAPKGPGLNLSVVHSNNWNYDYSHPDVTEESISDVYEDYRITCIHCGQSKIIEGDDG